MGVLWLRLLVFCGSDCWCFVAQTVGVLWPRLLVLVATQTLRVDDGVAAAVVDNTGIQQLYPTTAANYCSQLLYPTTPVISKQTAPAVTSHLPLGKQLDSWHQLLVDISCWLTSAAG